LTCGKYTFICIKYASGQYCPEAAEAMNLCCIKWIVNLESLEDLAGLGVD
jgi:hypothetical protein